MDDHNLRLHEGYHTADGAQTVDPFTNGSLKRRIWAVINGNNMLIVFIIVALSVSSLSSVRLDGPKSISNIFPKEGLDIPTNHVSCLPSLEACTACPTCSAPTCPTCSACDECFTAPKCAKSVPEVNCEETAAYHALHNRLHDCQSLITLQKSDCTKTVELQQLVLNADQFVEALQIQLAIAEREREELKLKLVSTDQQWFAIKERMEHAYEHIQKLHAEATYSSDHVKHLKSQISTFEDSLSHFTESVATSLILNFEESAKEVPMIMENAVRSGMITNDGIRDFVSPIEAISAIIDNIAHVSVQYMIKEIDMRIESFFATIEQPAVAVPATDRPAVIETAAVAAAAVGVAAPVMDTPVQDEVNRRDFALAAAGATVVRERTSPTFFPPFLRVDNKIKNFLNSIGLDGLNSMVPNFSGRVAYDALGIVPNVGMPTEVLNGNLDVGSCWPMNGTAGQITVQLRDFIHVDSISIDHILRSHAVNIRSAPRDFEFYGLLEDNGAVTEKLLLSGSYDIEQNSASQTFPVTDHYWGKFKFRYFTLKILDNHGLADYTCIYRLRVHGEPVHHRH